MEIDLKEIAWKQLIRDLLIYALIIIAAYGIGRGQSTKDVELNCNQFIVDNYIQNEEYIQSLPPLSKLNIILPFNDTQSINIEGETT